MSIRSDLREGREIGAPFCCRLRWALGYRRDPDGEQAHKRGIRLSETGVEFVPCGLIHRRHLSHAGWERVVERIATIADEEAATPWL